MNYNTILFRCGLSPESFKNFEHNPIIDDNGVTYYVEQITTNNKTCPYCNKEEKVIIHDYYYSKINITENDNYPEFLKIKRVRYKCKNCNLSFVPPIVGIPKGDTISIKVKTDIYYDFKKAMTFKQIANNYKVSQTTIFNVFDELVLDVPRASMPEILCIDEFKFSKDVDQKYCVALTNFKTGKIVDVIKNRKLDYLIEYFSSIDEKERNNVKYFVSDMYDQYATIKERFFPDAIHVIDLFHIIKQLTEAINSIRVDVMKTTFKGTPENYFFKNYWKLFLCSRVKIPYKTYTQKKTNITYAIPDLFEACLALDKDLLEGYSILQDILLTKNFENVDTGTKFIENISYNLEFTGNPKLISVGKTYTKWKKEIINAFLPETRKQRITNGKAEGNNNFIKTLIKISYGCKNFDRMRKRILLIKK